MSERRRSPLLEVHRKLGARLTEFGGWEMPLQYTGIVAEHNAVRGAAGLFDVSHLGKLRLRGPSAWPALEEALTASVEALPVGKAAYSLVLTDDGGCVDDVFIYRVAEEEWLVVPNAANVAAVTEMIRASGGELEDEWDRWAILALQGPQAYDVFDAVFPETVARSLKLHEFMTIDFFGRPGTVARTGYTGERGYELYVPASAAPEAFDALTGAGALPVGLGARDTLRLEMGYALYGHEIDLETNPLEAGLGWVLAWDTPFRGRAALEKVKAEGPRRKLFGIACRDRGVPRQGFGVFAGSTQVGLVRSGNHSPTLGRGIALALGPVESLPQAGAEVTVAARGRSIAGDIVKPPFIRQPSTGR